MSWDDLDEELEQAFSQYGEDKEDGLSLVNLDNPWLSKDEKLEDRRARRRFRKAIGCEIGPLVKPKNVNEYRLAILERERAVRAENERVAANRRATKQIARRLHARGVRTG